ncbi:MAG: hypothetical protein KIH63_004730 [Candidatus Saccharibacteria bacterium]|nr:hypothetical protein [Candidatus Saccharibacteria bacterium]
MTINPANFSNPIAIANGATGQATTTNAFDALSPLTTKGDVAGYTTTNARVAVGANTTVLIADSTQASGLNYAAAGTVTSFGITSTNLTIASTPITTSGTITIDTPISVAGNNMLANGTLWIWQRGVRNSASFSISASTTQYTADRWQFSCGANQASTVSLQLGTVNNIYTLKMQRNNGQTGTGTITLAQSLTRDMCIGSAGNVVTFSLKAKCGANYSPTSSLAVISIYSGTGSTDVSQLSTGFTGATLEATSSITLSTTVQSFSVSTGTLGASVTQLAVYVQFTPTGTAGADDSVTVLQLQLEQSPQATKFQNKSFEQEQLACLPFYQKSFNYNTAPAQNVGTSSGHLAFENARAGAVTQNSHYFGFFSTMRATPTITLYNPTAANAQINDQTAAADYTGSTTATVSRGGFAVTGTSAAGSAVNGRAIFHYTADAELT